MLLFPYTLCGRRVRCKRIHYREGISKATLWITIPSYNHGDLRMELTHWIILIQYTHSISMSDRSIGHKYTVTSCLSFAYVVALKISLEISALWNIFLLAVWTWPLKKPLFGYWLTIVHSFSIPQYSTYAIVVHKLRGKLWYFVMRSLFYILLQT